LSEVHDYATIEGKEKEAILETTVNIDVVTNALASAKTRQYHHVSVGKVIWNEKATAVDS